MVIRKSGSTLIMFRGKWIKVILEMSKTALEAFFLIQKVKLTKTIKLLILSLWI